MLSLLFSFLTFGDAERTPGVAAGFEVDMEPALWWQRKPKALDEKVAKKRLHEVAAVIVETAQEHALEQPPEAQRKAEIKRAVSPLLDSLAGFDYRPMYEAAYSRALTAVIAAQMRAKEEYEQAQAAALALKRMRDEEEIQLLLTML